MPPAPPFGTPKPLTLLLKLTPPPQTLCPEGRLRGGGGGALTWWSAQVEIMLSNYRTLHRVHGEQVGAASWWGCPRQGRWDPRMFRGERGAMTKGGWGVWAGVRARLAFLQVASYFGHSVAVTDVNGDG